MTNQPTRAIIIVGINASILQKATAGCKLGGCFIFGIDKIEKMCYYNSRELNGLTVQNQLHEATAMNLQALAVTFLFHG